MMHAPGLFDLSDHLARLSATGDPLEALERHVDFEAFRTVLMEALGYGVRAKGGRPPYDAGHDVQGACSGVDAQSE